MNKIKIISIWILSIMAIICTGQVINRIDIIDATSFVSNFNRLEIIEENGKYYFPLETFSPEFGELTGGEYGGYVGVYEAGSGFTDYEYYYRAGNFDYERFEDMKGFYFDSKIVVIGNDTIVDENDYRNQGFVLYDEDENVLLSYASSEPGIVSGQILITEDALYFAYAYYFEHQFFGNAILHNNVPDRANLAIHKISIGTKEVEWTEIFEVNAYWGFTDMALDSEDNLLAVMKGGYNFEHDGMLFEVGGADFAKKGLIFKFSPSGEILDHVIINGDGATFPYEIFLDDEDNVYALGTTSSDNLVINEEVYTSQQRLEGTIYCLKLNKSLDHVWEHMIPITSGGRMFDVLIEENNKILLTGAYIDTAIIEGVTYSKYDGTVIIQEFNALTGKATSRPVIKGRDIHFTDIKKIGEDRYLIYMYSRKSWPFTLFGEDFHNNDRTKLYVLDVSGPLVESLTKVSNIFSEDVIIFPNPVHRNDELKIELPLQIRADQKMDLTLISKDGSQNQLNYQVDGDLLRIILPNVLSGQYFLKVESRDLSFLKSIFIH